jgi:uncharacterized membrane protein YesL
MIWRTLSLAAGVFWRRLGIMVLANVVWLLLSLPIVTWPAATAGLFSLVRRVIEEELAVASRDAHIHDFWEGFRRYWTNSSLLAIIDLSGLGIIAVALVFYGRSGLEPLRWLVGPIGLIGLVWLTAQLYLYPLLLQRPERPVWVILREALLLALGYPLFSLSLLLTILVLFAGSVLLAGPVLFVIFSAIATLETVMLRQILIQRGEIQAHEP